MALSKSQKKKINKELKKRPILLLIIFLIAIFCAMIYGYFYLQPKQEEIVDGEISFHFLTLGNNSPGDSIYVQCGNVDILIDAGSNYNSANTIYDYVSSKMHDSVLEYVIVTHGDFDHIAGFVGNSTYTSLFERFTIQTIIDFPKTTKTTTTYNNYVQKRDNCGATHYTALQCFNNSGGAKSSYELASGISMNILYNKYYETSTTNENDNSVIVEFRQNSKKFLFTGDLEEDGETAFVEYYGSQLSQVELFKAGHHGSNTASNEVLLQKIQPKIVAINCVAGGKYNFPHQETINRIAQYTSQVYVTQQNSGTTSEKDLNGNIVVTSNANGVSVNCSNNNKTLKDSDWFKNSSLSWPS